MIFRRIASLTNVNEPLMSACEAMIAAKVAMIMLTARKLCGTIKKKGLPLTPNSDSLYPS